MYVHPNRCFTGYNKVMFTLENSFENFLAYLYIFNYYTKWKHKLWIYINGLKTLKIICLKSIDIVYHKKNGLKNIFFKRYFQWIDW